MLNQDRLIVETYERKNELESLSNVWKDKINSNYKDFTRPEDIPKIIKFLEEQNEWLYGEG